MPLQAEVGSAADPCRPRETRLERPEVAVGDPRWDGNLESKRHFPQHLPRQPVQMKRRRTIGGRRVAPDPAAVHRDQNLPATNLALSMLRKASSFERNLVPGSSVSPKRPRKEEETEAVKAGK